MSQKTIVFATSNPGKITELNDIIRSTKGFEDIHVVSMRDVGIADEIIENGNTYKENALIKSDFVCRKTNLIALGDGSGFEVSALNGKPGLFSHRFMGTDTSQEIKNKGIIDAVYNNPDTGCNKEARFICAMSASLPNGRTYTTEAAFYGEIAKTPKGENGFGYDPIFFVPRFGKTAAELTPDEKNEISHRGMAFREMLDLLKKEGVL